MIGKTGKDRRRAESTGNTVTRRAGRRAFWVIHSAGRMTLVISPGFWKGVGFVVCACVHFGGGGGGRGPTKVKSNSIVCIGRWVGQSLAFFLDGRELWQHFSLWIRLAMGKGKRGRES